MEIKTIKTSLLGQNCYLLKNKDKGILIDPGLGTKKIEELIKDTKVEYILLTHCHFDHIHSVNKIREGKIVIGSSNCRINATDPSMVLGNKESVLKRPQDEIMEDGEEREFCGIKIKCIYTPGHTNCSCCYLAEDVLFSGDTLFYQSIGRYDFKTGNFKEIENSIKNKIYTLPDITKVYAGHGDFTTVGFEKKNNPYITE